VKSNNRRVLAALVFGFLTLGAGAAFAQEPERLTPASSWMSRWYKAKYGRELSGPALLPQTSNGCCKHCC
jgi:hypothetical protein